MNRECDFSGWATKNDLLCSDGRIIRRDAFKECDGKKVPLVWNHVHNDPFNVLGHALLFNKKDGVWAECYLNDSEQGRNAKLIVEHGDVDALSIFANKLKQQGNNVLHGEIKEVSLVLSGANPGAFIDQMSVSHSEDGDDNEAIIYTGENISLYHSESKKEENMRDPKIDIEIEKDDDDDKKTKDDETVQDVFNTLNEKQKTVVYALIGQALEDAEKEKGEEKDMKHNVFEGETNRSVICHADQEAIVSLAKNSQVGSFQTALEIYADDNNLQHDDIAPSSGFIQDTTVPGNVSWLFPEYKDVRPGAPELITSDQGWISTVMNKVHKSPISRIRTGQVDVRNIEALRAKGYEKGKKKSITGNFKLVRRTTDPQTIYVKNALHRDDIVDITDFDYVQYLYNIDKMMLNEEIATAIMLGDGREDGDPDKIYAEHIRPIWLDDDLYTIHKDLDIEEARASLQGTNTGANFGDNYVYMEAMVNTLLYAREEYKGTGTPDLFITPHMLNVMLLARDLNGRRIYSSVSELATALNVGNIYTAEQFANKTRRTEDNKTKKLVCIVANLADYSLGATKGGEVTHFTQFDIDFNQEKSLLETRCSGALTRVYSAIVIEEDVTESSNNNNNNNEDDGQG